MPRWFIAALLVGAIVVPARAQLTPEQTIKSMTVADGLQVELFAAEPMVINPTSMDVDHLGRVWVCEAVNYRRKNFGRPMLREAGDRIVILTDKDGDGKADESTVFYQGKDLYGPIGICVLPQPSKEAKGGFAYRVLVCQSPDILEFWDRDGDGKADGPPKKFLTGFGGFDHDHGVHGINVGPDGKLYFTVGDQGVKGLQSSDGKGRKWSSNSTDCQAGTVWRCDQDGTNVELIAHNFRNNYECCVNSFGEIWLSDNDDDGNQQTRICHVMPGGNYGYFPRGPGQSHWHEEQPGIVHKTLRTGFGSPTGICFYEGTLLPKKYQGQLLHCDAGPREFRAFHIKPKGAGYELEKENLITSTDSWFRLSDVCVAPDGSVMLADWYDPGVGGHGMGDWTRGRIYRVTPKGHKGYKVPALDVQANDGLMGALLSPCLGSRALAIAKISTTDPESFLSAVGQHFVQFKEKESRFEGQAMSLARTLWMLLENSGDNSKRNKNSVIALFELFMYFDGVKIDDSGLFIRIGARFANRFGYWPVMTRERGEPQAEKIFAGMVKQYENPRGSTRNTRIDLREVLLAMRQMPVDRVAKLFPLYARLYDGQDIFYRAALNIACGTDPARRDAILADFDKHFPEWNDKVADLVWELRPKSVLPRLGKLLEDPKLTAAQKGRIVDILAASDELSAGKTMLKLLAGDASAEVKTRALENLRLHLQTKWKGLASTKELETAIAGLLNETKTRTVGLQLVAAAKFGTGREQVVAIASDAKEVLAVRQEAIRTLGQLGGLEALKALKLIGTPENPLSIDCVKAIGQLLPNGPKGDETGQEALDALKRAILATKATPELKSAALVALAGNRRGTMWLLEARETKELPAELVADAGRLLRNSPFQGERNKAMLLFPAPGKLDPKKLPAPAVLAKRTGDAKRGEAILAASLKGEAQCLRCHTVRGVGGNIGPDQSMIGKKASRENLFESILLPSKAIADQYVQWKVDTTDGKSITGLLMGETKDDLTIRDANGKDYIIPTKDVDNKTKSLVSIMPDNLAAALTEDELVDLVEYMLTLKTASITPETWNILGPFANDEQDSALDKDLGLEALKSIDLSATLKGKAGDVKWTTVRTNGSGYLDLMAHHAGKSAATASYLYRVIDSPTDQDGVILFGNDDGAKIWVNSTEAFVNRDHFAATPGRHQIPVKLKKGPNAILIKIVNGSDPHGLYFALTSEQELKVGK